METAKILTPTNGQTAEQVAQAAAAAQAPTEEAAGGMPRLDLTQIPELPALEGLRAGRQLTERLNPEQKALAERYAATVKLDDIRLIGDIGSQQETDSRKVISLNGKLIREDARICDLGEVGNLANELKERLTSLGVGSLEKKWWDTLIGHIPVVSKYADRLGRFVERYEKITDRLEEIFRAMHEERAELNDLYEKGQAVQRLSQEALGNITIAGAAIEMLLKQKEEEFKREAEQLRAKPKIEDEDLDRITEMQQTLSALDRRLVTLKIMRVETRNSMRTMRDLLNTAVQAGSMLDDQLMMQETVWKDQINNAIIAQREAGVAALIRESRSFTDKLLESNQQQISSTIAELNKLAGEPGVSIEVLQGVVDAQTAMHEQMLKTSVENRRKLQEAAAAMDSLDQRLSEQGDDLDSLLEALEVGDQSDEVLIQ